MDNKLHKCPICLKSKTKSRYPTIKSLIDENMFLAAPFFYSCKTCYKRHIQKDDISCKKHFKPYILKSVIEKKSNKLYLKEQIKKACVKYECKVADLVDRGTVLYRFSQKDLVGFRKKDNKNTKTAKKGFFDRMEDFELLTPIPIPKSDKDICPQPYYLKKEVKQLEKMLSRGFFVPLKKSHNKYTISATNAEKKGVRVYSKKRTNKGNLPRSFIYTSVCKKEKLCNCCLEEKLLGRFCYNAGTPDNLAYTCNSCSSVAMNKRYELDGNFRKNAKKNAGNWKSNNRDKVRQYHKQKIGRRFGFSESMCLPEGKTREWYYNKYLPTLFYPHPIRGVKMVNRGESGRRVEGGRGPGYETIYENDIEMPIYEKDNTIRFQLHWQIDHTIPISVVSKLCDEFKYDRKSVRPNHYLNTSPMWNIENLHKGDSIETELLENKEKLIDLLKCIFPEQDDDDFIDIISFLAKHEPQYKYSSINQ